MSTFGQRLRQRAHDLGDALLQRLVEHHLPPLKRPDHLGGEVVGGRPEAAAGDHQVHPLAAMKASAACMSSGRSPTIVV